MHTSVIIKCLNCGNKRRADRTWLRQIGLISSEKQPLMNVLHDNYNLLSCTRCKHKNPELIGQVEKPPSPREKRRAMNRQSGSRQQRPFITVFLGGSPGSGRGGR